MGKSQKTKLARKKAKRKKIIIWVISITAVLAISAALILYFVNRENNSDRVYVSGDQTVTLNDDGTFKAELYHGVNISGTYTESTEGGVVIITYLHDGIVTTGTISGNTLIIPEEWEDDHGHGYNFTLK